jgi:hypothetical protein
LGDIYKLFIWFIGNLTCYGDIYKHTSSGS